MTAEVNSWRVAEAFEGRCVFVTGASGFLGKVLVEKLLYSIPQIKNIYLLIRPLKNLTPKERLEKILQSPIYGRIRASNEELFKKLVPIAGDLMEPDIGLNEADARLLCDQVAIVFHCAATVKFDEKLRVSIQMNVIGTQRLVALCHKMTQLIRPKVAPLQDLRVTNSVTTITFPGKKGNSPKHKQGYIHIIHRKWATEGASQNAKWKSFPENSMEKIGKGM
ncbi:male sterility protein domain-containing protein [Ditylenchus destructor]|uniref:Fatty acyl-CoA reductase n=1 Tax=Ditylenchus destructor TaxID=166010 RepID=A0AAD4MWF8_9BILA|nr:male sterility protein domain-containing protein [Ditylenchus destructor]